MYSSEGLLDSNYSNLFIEDPLLVITNTPDVTTIRRTYQQTPQITSPLIASISSFRNYNHSSTGFFFEIKKKIETINERVDNYIPKIVHEIKKNNDLFNDINEEEVIKNLKIIFSKIDSSDLLYLNKPELEARVIKILSINKLSNLLDDFNSEQKRDFHECIKRRPLFE